MAQSKHWCFTINNWSNDHVDHLAELGGDPAVAYLVFGREVGDSGTPHLQGFVSFAVRRRFATVVALLGAGAHVERARGTPAQAGEYCKKDGDFEEFGEIPVSQGKRTDIDRYRQWVTDFHADTDRRPCEREIACEFPSLFLRYRRNLMDLAAHLCPHPVIQGGEFNDWQQELVDDLKLDADDRKILFYVDPDGGKGKSWFCRRYLSLYPEQTQFLGVGKRDDLAHCIDPNKSVFLINVPRRAMEFLQYTILEQLKDSLVFSPKYESTIKVLVKKAHVVVFCNEYPDETKMSADRYEIHTL